jgi:aminopeptidase-like protein
MIDEYTVIQELADLPRYLISDDLEQSHNIIAKHYPTVINRYTSGLKCWTWTIPKKWSCDSATIKNSRGYVLFDLEYSPFFVASYSISVDQVVTREELFNHLHFHPMDEDQIPFIFYYYQENWGFCISKNDAKLLVDDSFYVCIQSIHSEGELLVSEWNIAGKTEDTFVIAAHLDHPYQANDGLSGVATGLSIMNNLSKIKDLNYSYKLLITSETIGSIAWLSKNEDKIPKIKSGIFLDMTGTNLAPGLQKSYSGNSIYDEIFSYYHLKKETNAWVADYRFLVGNDERQFNAPGVRIPMLSYARVNPWGHEYRPYKEYHSNKDTIEIISKENLQKTTKNLVDILIIMDKNYYPLNLFKGEVFLSGLSIKVDRNKELDLHRSLLKIMDMIDGSNSIFHIAKKLDIDFSIVYDFCEKLHEKNIIEKKYL